MKRKVPPNNDGNISFILICKLLHITQKVNYRAMPGFFTFSPFKASKKIKGAV